MSTIPCYLPDSHHNHLLGRSPQLLTWGNDPMNSFWRPSLKQLNLSYSPQRIQLVYHGSDFVQLTKKERTKQLSYEGSYTVCTLKILPSSLKQQNIRMLQNLQQIHPVVFFFSAIFRRLELAKASSKDVNVDALTGHFCVPEPFLCDKKQGQLGRGKFRNFEDSLHLYLAHATSMSMYIYIYLCCHWHISICIDCILKWMHVLYQSTFRRIYI